MAETVLTAPPSDTGQVTDPSRSPSNCSFPRSSRTLTRGWQATFRRTHALRIRHATTGGGTLDISAPTTGAWKGVAIYQDPSLTSGIDVSAAGNSPTWDITGLVYLPHASVTSAGL